LDKGDFLCKEFDFGPAGFMDLGIIPRAEAGGSALLGFDGEVENVLEFGLACARVLWEGGSEKVREENVRAIQAGVMEHPCEFHAPAAAKGFSPG
jgi:hypothetical protein